jgi:hypothetical protein
MNDFRPPDLYESLSDRPVSNATSEPPAAGCLHHSVSAAVLSARRGGFSADGPDGSPVRGAAIVGEQKTSMDRGIRRADMRRDRTLRRYRQVRFVNSHAPRGRQRLRQ